MDVATLRRWWARVAGPRPSRTARPTRDQRWLAMAALLGLAAVAAASWRAQQPPPPVPSPATAFSAERAREHLRAMTGQRPTPVGSPGGDEVRDYLVAQLSAIGLATEVQAGLGAGTFGTTTVAGRIENVVATLPGRDPTGRVLLSAHYDTTAVVPGDPTGLGDQPRVLLANVGRLGLDSGEVVAGLLLVRGLSVRDVEASLANALGAGGLVEVDRVSRVTGHG